MGTEKRQSPRVSANLFADLVDDAGNSLGRAVVTDVSVGGLAVETEVQLPINESVSCHIEIPLEMKCQIVRAGNRAAVRLYGLRFEKVSIIEKFFLKRFLRHSLKTRKV